MPVIRKKRFENLARKFDADMDSQKLSVGTRRFALQAVINFFRSQDLDLKLNGNDKPKGESEEGRAATKEEIETLVKMARPRERAIIYMLKDTGLRCSDLAALNVGDVDLESEFPPLTVNTKKQKIIAKTFLGPEAQEAVKIYLDYRRRGTRRISPEDISNKTENKTPLFKYDKTAIERMNANSISVYIGRLIKTSRIKGLTAHSFRRFFETALEAGGVHPTWIDRMVGHKPLGSRSSYSKPTDEQLRDKYIKAYDHLRIGTLKIMTLAETLNDKIVDLQEKLDLTTKITSAMMRAQTLKEMNPSKAFTGDLLIPLLKAAGVRLDTDVYLVEGYITAKDTDGKYKMILPQKYRSEIFG